MISTRSATTLSRQSAVQGLRALYGRSIVASSPTFYASLTNNGLHLSTTRPFSTTQPAKIKEFFPAPDAPSIRTTEAAWPHPVYTPAQMNSVVIAHRTAKTWSDYVAIGMVRCLRFGLDLATGYRHDPKPVPGKPVPTKSVMNEKKWMIRFVFLESVAGVPGMVAGMLRHLHSMRRMQRDNGWIETLLEESYNERMHLLTFLKMSEPGWFMRLMVLGAQGFFFNFMFLSYLVSPRTCHRFVGYLEEEAVLTYTRAIEDIDKGRLPMFEKMPAPDIALQYWHMPKGSTMRDVLLYVRADESRHREVNHTLGNLDQKNDPNPYVSEYKDDSKAHPTKDLAQSRPTGWERNEVL